MKAYFSLIIIGH